MERLFATAPTVVVMATKAWRGSRVD
jgi:hypothetical protein